MFTLHCIQVAPSSEKPETEPVLEEPQVSLESAETTKPPVQVHEEDAPLHKQEQPSKLGVLAQKEVIYSPSIEELQATSSKAISTEQKPKEHKYVEQFRFFTKCTCMIHNMENVFRILSYL